MASKSAYLDSEKGAEVVELLEVLEKALDRLKVLYEQYFLGIQKQAPSQLHTDAERRLRDLTQLQIRNTALRYRLATVTQKFGSYNQYWRRTLREIEQGRYVRNLAKLRRQAAQGLDLPEEILAAMPARMRDQVRRDREVAVAQASRRAKPESDGAALIVDRPPPRTQEPSTPPMAPNTHRLDLSEEFDVDAMFAAVASDDAPPPPPRPVVPSSPPAPDPSAVIPAGARTRSSTLSGVRFVPPGTTKAPPMGAEAPPLPPLPGRPTAPAPSPAPSPARPPPQARPPAPANVSAGRAPTGAPASPRAPTSPGASRPAPPAAPPPGMSDADVRALYAQYAKARALVGQPADGQTYAQLVKTLHKQAPKIMADHKAAGVEFSVIIKDQQVVLKAKPKK